MFQTRFQTGQPAPWFVARSPYNPKFHFDTVAGRPIVLSFIGTGQDPVGQRVLAEVYQNAKAFDGDNLAFFAVSVDPNDEQLMGTMPQWYGFNFFWDFDRKVSELYGAIRDGTEYVRFSVVLDERLRVMAVVPIEQDSTDHVSRLLSIVRSVPPMETPRQASLQAPVLIVPRIFEPQLCQTLMKFYTDRGGKESGFMAEVDGKTVELKDPNHKIRSDQLIDDDELRKVCMHRIHDRLAPEIAKAFQFKATRIERYVVACYTAEAGGHFRSHRDNTTKGTAHRRFAVSLNLNTGEYEGGNLRFPEFGMHTYSAPPGGAVVFSCSLLHEATPVTSGRRFAFLPFLYDDAAAAIRQQNLQFLGQAPVKP